MSIRLKLTIMFLVFVLVPSLFVGVLTFANYKNSLEAEHLSYVRDIAAFKADKIETYFAGLKGNIEVAQGYYNIRKNLPVLVRLAKTPDAPGFLAARKMLDTQLRHMQSVLSLSDIILVDPAGEVVYSSNPEHRPTEFLHLLTDSHQKAFAEGKNKVYFSDIFLDKTKGDAPTMLVTAPVAGFDGAFAGVIAFEVDVNSIYHLMQDVTGLGDTGETLVGKKIGNEVLILNPLRHDPQSALRRKVRLGQKEGYPIQQAAQGRTGAGQATDYRGEKVVAAWRYLPSLDWGIVAKVDAREAFADVTSLRKLVVIILSFVFVLCGIIAFSIAQSISAPIKTLSKGVEIVGSGNLDYKVGTDLKDEIGQLSRVFDKMTGDLKKITASRDELNSEITERKRAEKLLSENEGRLKRSQEIAHLGSWELDFVNNRLYWSDEVYRIFGLQPQEFDATYEAFLEAVHPDDRMALDAAYSGSLQEGRDTYEIEHRVIRKYTGEIRYVHEKCEHFRDKNGRIIRSVGMVHDITERKMAEKKIISLNEELKHHVLQLEAANRELEAFSYSVSHDLRSPLRSVAGFSQALFEDYADKFDAEGRDALERILAATQRMGRLIDDLLNLSRVSRAEMKREEVNLSGLAGKIADMLMKTQPERQAEFHIAEGLVAQGDEHLLTVVLENLLGNAWKFTGKNPQAVIEFGAIDCSKQNADCGIPNNTSEIRNLKSEIVYFVKDNGAGFDMSYAGKMFSPFQRLHSVNEFPGTGIGLATVKRIINRHGGSVWIEAEVGKGTTVYFTI